MAANPPPPSSEPSRAGAAAVLLVAVTAVWGSTFFLIRDLVRTVEPVDFLAVRFALAALVMLVVFHRAVARLDRRALIVGLALGVVYGIAQILQTIGLASTPASRSGFLTGLYVVLTPVIGAVALRDVVHRRTWAAVALAVVGTAVLSLGAGGGAMGIGDVLTVLAAAVYAAHIVALGRTSSPDDATGLATVQVLAVALVTTGAAVPGGIDTPVDVGGWVSLLYMALVAGALAMWAQTWAQSHLSAARAAVVMTLEPVFAAAFAVAFGGESPSWRLLVGGALVLTAMYVVESA